MAENQKKKDSSPKNWKEPSSPAAQPLDANRPVNSKIKIFVLCVIVLFAAQYARHPSVQTTLHKASLKLGEYIPGLNDLMRSFHAKPDKKPTTTAKGSADSKWSKWSKDHDWKSGPSKDPRVKILNDDDIKYVTGGKMYLILIGHVFDVSDGGAEYYSSGSGYHGFIGQDASRAFITGDFTKSGLTNNLDGLLPQDYMGLSGWLQFYFEHEKYKFVGYHIGRYFNEKGEETEKMTELKKWMTEAVVEAEKEGDLRKLFPTCNVEWTADIGSTVWCSERSGGIDRDWIGYPRKFVESPDKPARCACVHANYLADPRVHIYPNCDSMAEKCELQETTK